MEGIRYRQITNIEPSFSKTTGKRCFRIGGRRGPRLDKLPLPCVQLVPPGHRGWQRSVVYQVSVAPELRARWPKQPPNFYVCAEDAGAVHKYLDKRYGNIARRHMGTAHLVLTDAMAAVSTRPPSGRVGAHASDISKRVLKMFSTDGAEVYTITVKDELVYAVSALRNGRATIEVAYKRAANRVAGMLRHFGGHLLDKDLQTPFPEVKRKGRVRR